jgi:hypothetical protein
MTRFTREELHAMLSALCYVQTLEEAEGGLDASFLARFPAVDLDALMDAFDRCGEHLAWVRSEDWAAEAEAEGADISAHVTRQMPPPAAWTRAELREVLRALDYALTPSGELTARFAWTFEGDVARGELTAEHVDQAAVRCTAILYELAARRERRPAR